MCKVNLFFNRGAIEIMKKKLLSWLVILAILVSVFSAWDSIKVSAVSKKNSYITNKKFKGTFEYMGQKGSYEEGWYAVVVCSITKNGKVRFYLDKGGRNASPLYCTGVLSAPIKGNKAEFMYKEDGWGNRGKGTIVFNKNGTIYLTVHQTYTAEGNRSSLQISKTIFKRKKK